MSLCEAVENAQEPDSGVQAVVVSSDGWVAVRGDNSRAIAEKLLALSTPQGGEQ